MWNAIKSDLVSFVSTVKDDAVKAVNKVIGDNENEEGQESLEIQRQQRIIDLTSKPIPINTSNNKLRQDFM
jgi:hypothetical protein